jgi:hypothetical protein
MIRVKHTVIFIIITAICGCSNIAIAQNQFNGTSAEADKLKNDKQLPIRINNKSHTITYIITNDSSYIYFIASVKDWRMMNRVLQDGITLYIDPKGKKSKKKMMLSFPEQKEDLTNLLKDADSTTILNTLVFQSNVYETKNFLNIDNGIYAIIDKTTKLQLELIANKESGLIYEAKIPIENILKDGLTEKNLDKNISIGIILNANDSKEKGFDSGIKNNDNTAAAFQGDNGFGTKGGVEGLGGTAVQNGRKVAKTSRFSKMINPSSIQEEELWYNLVFFKFPIER